MKNLRSASIRLVIGDGMNGWILVVAMLSCFPVNLPWGTAYPGEITLIVCAVRVLGIHMVRSRVSPSTFAAVTLLAALSFVSLLTQVPAAFLLRALVVFVCGLFLIDNIPSRERWLRAIPPAAVGCLIMILLEIWTGLPLIRGASRGFLDAGEARILGPLTPGPTAALLLVALYLAIRSRAILLGLLLSLGIFATGSRTHLLAMIIMFALLSLKSGIRAMLTAGTTVLALGAASVVWPAMRDRLLAEDPTYGGRSQVWREAVVEIRAVWPHGQLTGLMNGPYQTHQQILSFALLGGLVGSILAIFLLLCFLQRSWSSSTLSLAVPLLMSAMAGEYLVPITPVASLAAIAAWLTVTPSSRQSLASSQAPTSLVAPTRSLICRTSVATISDSLPVHR